MHTRTTTAAILATATLFLTGCSGSGDDPAPKTTTPTTTAAATPDPADFVQAVHGANINSWATAGPSDDELAAYPEAWCGSLTQGHSVSWMFGEGGQYPIGQTWGTKKADAYQVLVLAVGLYCPSEKAKVEQELRATGDY